MKKVNTLLSFIAVASLLVSVAFANTDTAIKIRDNLAKNLTETTTPPDTIPTTEQLLQQVADAANKVPLNQLLKNPTFVANWQDANHLINKINELTAKGDMTTDEKTMYAMAKFTQYKEFTSTVDIEVIRVFLGFYYSDISYDDPKQKSDSEIVNEYIRVMMKMEDEMQNTPDLNPVYRDKKYDVDVDDL